MKQLVHIAIAALALAVCGPALADENRAANVTGAAGYFSAQSEDGRWLVAYTGSPGETPQEIAERVLQRASEVAAEQNQEWFAVIGSASSIVEIGVADDLAVRAGNFMGVGEFRNTFGGEMVPMDVLERWEPRQARRTVLLIQLGSGDEASFPGLDHVPQIFPAAGAE